MPVYQSVHVTMRMNLQKRMITGIKMNLNTGPLQKGNLSLLLPPDLASYVVPPVCLVSFPYATKFIYINPSPCSASDIAMCGHFAPCFASTSVSFPP